MSLSESLHHRLIFVHGKGGVGKSTLARAIALQLSRSGKQVMLIRFDPAGGPPQRLGPTLWQTDVSLDGAFEEYATLKFGKFGKLGKLGKLEGPRALRPLRHLTHAFTQNKLIRYLVKAAPGVQEVVLLGKAWFESSKYDHTVVDMPSTGYALAMFQSTNNFSLLFKGGPLSRDSEEMLETFRNPALCTHLIVALPEEMPLSEGLDLAGHLRELFPENPPRFLVNKLFPRSVGSDATTLRDSDDPNSMYAYLSRRSKLEDENLQLWSRAGVSYDEVPYLSPETFDIASDIGSALHSRGLL